VGWPWSSCRPFLRLPRNTCVFFSCHTACVGPSAASGRVRAVAVATFRWRPSCLAVLVLGGLSSTSTSSLRPSSSRPLLNVSAALDRHPRWRERTRGSFVRRHPTGGESDTEREGSLLGTASHMSWQVKRVDRP
jgi:hypothetical protein